METEQPAVDTPPNFPPEPPVEPPRPVAYDSEGRPLYAAPSPPSPQLVHLSRAVSPLKPQISPQLQAKHDASCRQYPMLNISESEYVISEVKRHPIGMLAPIVVSGFFIALIASIIINYSLMTSALGLIAPPSLGVVALIGLGLIFLFALGAYISVWIYSNNRFFLTNESVVQEIQTGLFGRREQTISLANIEDASYRQQGILQILFGYGSIRLSTQGDETTYRFSYVTNPKAAIATLNNAVEAFKNGRPAEDY